LCARDRREDKGIRDVGVMRSKRSARNDNAKGWKGESLTINIGEKGNGGSAIEDVAIGMIG
jgi:hypothetical protein